MRDLYHVILSWNELVVVAIQWDTRYDVWNLSNCPLLGTETDLLQNAYLLKFLSVRCSVPPFLYRLVRASIIFSWKFPFKLTIPAVDLLLVSLLLFTFAFFLYLCFVFSVLSFSRHLSSVLICSSRTCPPSFFVRSIVLVFCLTYFCYLLLRPTVR